MSTRREIADALKQAACSYWAHKKFSCHLEIGLARCGKYKADLLAVNLKTELVVCEIKSCKADFKTDDDKDKWQNYLSACNRMYFVFTEHTAGLLTSHFDRFRKFGVGVLVLDRASGYLRCLVPAKWRPVSGPMQKSITTRLAWRNGDYSKRTNRQRRRIFLEGK